MNLQMMGSSGINELPRLAVTYDISTAPISNQQTFNAPSIGLLPGDLALIFITNTYSHHNVVIAGFTGVEFAASGGSVSLYAAVVTEEMGDVVVSHPSNSTFNLMVAGFRNGPTVTKGSSQYIRNYNETPNPPALTATGGLWIAAVGVNKAVTDWTPPAGYTLGWQTESTASSVSKIAFAYKYEELTSDNPGLFIPSTIGYYASITACFGE